MPDFDPAKERGSYSLSVYKKEQGRKGDGGRREPDRLMCCTERISTWDTCCRLSEHHISHNKSTHQHQVLLLMSLCPVLGMDQGVPVGFQLLLSVCFLITWCFPAWISGRRVSKMYPSFRNTVLFELKQLDGLFKNSLILAVFWNKK